MAGGFGFGQGLPFGEGGAQNAPPSAPVSDILAGASSRLLVGTGYLSVDGAYVALLRDVEYYTNASIYEHVLGGRGGQVEARVPVVVEAGLKIGYADILGNVGLFMLNADNVLKGVLADHTAVLTLWGAPYSITFPKCNIMPSASLHMTAAGWAGANLEIRSSRQTLPVFA